MRCQWAIKPLQIIADCWLEKFHRDKSLRTTEHSAWWSFIFNWPEQLNTWLCQFVEGRYCFSPMRQYRFLDETVRYWDFKDRLMVKLTLDIIKPTFKHLVSNRCYHLQGPSGVQTATRHIRHVMCHKQYHYVIRADIKIYYASIDRKGLLQQLHQHFDDPRLLHYFEHIVNVAVDYHGNVFVPEKGIPRRSSLSPFFGALYLSVLDEAFSHRQGIQYFRFMDDVLILATTRRQYRRAKKIFHGVLATLELSLPPAKTRMGSIQQGFHFLGCSFDVPRSRQSKTQVDVHIHSRSCARALDKVKALRDNASHPATIQRYLVRWATWWSNTIQTKGAVSLLIEWIHYTSTRDLASVWFGRGLIPRSSL